MLSWGENKSHRLYPITRSRPTLLEPPHKVAGLPEQGISQPLVAGAPVAAVWAPQSGEGDQFRLVLTLVMLRTAFAGEQG